MSDTIEMQRDWPAAMPVPERPPADGDKRRQIIDGARKVFVAQGYDGALQATKEFLNHANAQITEQYLGLTHERQIRDETIAGKPFLSAMTEADNIVNIADWKAK